MRLSALLLAAFVATSSHAFSLNDLRNYKKEGLLSVGEVTPKMLTQNDGITRMITTRRETIQMPSQTPMVPWKVSMSMY